MDITSARQDSVSFMFVSSRNGSGQQRSLHRARGRESTTAMPCPAKAVLERRPAAQPSALRAHCESQTVRFRAILAPKHRLALGARWQMFDVPHH
jgi:hypothetical protein